MERRMPLGRSGRVPLDVDWRVVVVMAFVASGVTVGLPRHAPGRADALYWVTAAAATALFVGCLLVHGLAQGVAAGREGLRIATLRLLPLGGVVRAEGEPVSTATELRMAAAGLISFVGLSAGLSAVAWVLAAADLPEVGVWTCGWLARLTAVLAVLQVLPVVPLDGGRIMRAVVWRRYGNRDAAVTATAVGGRLTSWIVIGAGAVAFLAGAPAEGILTSLTGWMLLGGDRVRDLGHRPMTVAES